MVLELKKFDMNCINFERGAPSYFYNWKTQY